jgi:hypothetical protein
MRLGYPPTTIGRYLGQTRAAPGAAARARADAAEQPAWLAGRRRAMRASPVADLVPSARPRARARAHAATAATDADGGGALAAELHALGGEHAARAPVAWMRRCASSPPVSTPGAAFAGFAPRAAAPPAAAPWRLDDDLFAFLHDLPPRRTASAASLAPSDDGENVGDGDSALFDDAEDAPGNGAAPSAGASRLGGGARVVLSSPRSAPIAVSRPPLARSGGSGVGGVGGAHSHGGGAFSWRARAAEGGADARAGGAFVAPHWREARRSLDGGASASNAHNADDATDESDDLASVRSSLARAHTHASCLPCARMRSHRAAQLLTLPLRARIVLLFFCSPLLLLTSLSCAVLFARLLLRALPAAAARPGAARLHPAPHGLHRVADRRHAATAADAAAAALAAALALVPAGGGAPAA